MPTTHRSFRAASLALVVSISGCGWDGPAIDVRVVPPSTAPVVGATDVEEAADLGDSDAEPMAADAPALTPDPNPAGEILVRAAASEPPVLPRVVGVVGDSLMVSAEDELAAELRQLGIDSVVDARESRRMTAGSSDLPSGASAIEEVGADLTPELWVIELGTNDVGAQVDSERFRADVRELLALIPLDAPLVWVDIWIRDRDESVVAANELLRAELRSRVGPTAVVDWYSRGADDGVITGDGIHLTEIGQQEFADAIIRQIVAVSGH